MGVNPKANFKPNINTKECAVNDLVITKKCN